MDLPVLIGIAVAFLSIIITLFYLQSRNKKTEHRRVAPERGAVRVQEGVPRRAQIARNQRNRLRNAAASNEAPVPVDVNAQQDDSDEGSEGIPAGHVLDEKMGTKKRAKLEAKEQKRLLREQELKMREERKLKEQKLEEEKKAEESRAAEAERKQAEAEQLARAERERKEYEEYLKMKEAFSVEEEGFEEGDIEEKDNLLADFIQYIKDNKVIILEDLATEFKLKTQQAIDRIQELQANGTLTGVIDDRGKFIYVSEEELLAVAKFIKRRGRVSIAELAESSNTLINLVPVSGV